MAAALLSLKENLIACKQAEESAAAERALLLAEHEAAEAMGAIGDVSIVPVLKKHAQDPLPEVSESCDVALDLLKWVASAEFENAEW